MGVCNEVDNQCYDIQKKERNTSFSEWLNAKMWHMYEDLTLFTKCQKCSTLQLVALILFFSFSI